MFRRLPHTLPPDPTFPADLEKLGFFVNSDDKIRQIKNPSQKYQYNINVNDRVNQAYKHANNCECLLCFTLRCSVFSSLSGVCVV